MLGKEVITCYSSGSHPSGKVNKKAIASMKETGYALSTHISKSLYEVPDMKWDLVVTMGCGDECPNIKARQRRDWEIPDPKTMDLNQFREVRDLIREKVAALIDEFKLTEK